MKCLLAFLLGLILVSCVQKKDENTGVNPVEKKKNPENGSLESPVGNDKYPHQVYSGDDGKLTCKDLGEDDFGFPSSEVYVSVNSQLTKISKCIVCQEFERDQFDQFHVPNETISVSGGWYAGGGDYFYSILNESGNVEVYEGWIDEGQDDLGENPYHWKLLKEFEVK